MRLRPADLPWKMARWERGGGGGGVRVEGVETDTKRRKEQQSMLKRVEPRPKVASEKIDRSINLSELTGYKKMFTFTNEANTVRH